MRVRIRKRLQRLIGVTILLAVPVTSIVGQDETGAAGAELYQRCAACHLPDGTGVPGVFPPLGPQLSILNATDEGRAYLVLVVARGLSGTIEIDGATYNGIMPAQSAMLDGEDIAAVLNYVNRTFGAPGDAARWRFSGFDVETVLEQFDHIQSPHQVRAFRDKVLAARGSDASNVKGVASVARARVNWQLNCQGCHGSAAHGSSGGAPNMAGEVARFLAVDGGREFLGQVPGVANAPLSSARLAELLNWLLYRFDPEHVPADFSPYTGDEIEGLRRQVLIEDAPLRRAELIRELAHERSSQGRE